MGGRSQKVNAQYEWPSGNTFLYGLYRHSRSMEPMKKNQLPRGMWASLTSVQLYEGNLVQQILGFCDSGHLGLISVLNQDIVLHPGQSEPWWHLWKPHKVCLCCFSFNTRIVKTHLNDLSEDLGFIKQTTYPSSSVKLLQPHSLLCYSGNLSDLGCRANNKDHQKNGSCFLK